MYDMDKPRLAWGKLFAAHQTLGKSTDILDTHEVTSPAQIVSK
jgi:hypothetical protein